MLNIPLGVPFPFPFQLPMLPLHVELNIIVQMVFITRSPCLQCDCCLLDLFLIYIAAYPTQVFQGVPVENELEDDLMESRWKSVES